MRIRGVREKIIVFGWQRHSTLMNSLQYHVVVFIILSPGRTQKLTVSQSCRLRISHRRTLFVTQVTNFLFLHRFTVHCTVEYMNLAFKLNYLLK